MSKINNKSNTNTINWETMLIIGVLAFIIYVFNKSKWDLDNLFKNITSLEWWKGLLKGNVTTHPTQGGVSDGTDITGTPAGTKKKTKGTVVAGDLEVINQDVDNRFTYNAKYFQATEYFGAGVIPDTYRSNYNVLSLQLDRIREAWGAPIKITKGYQKPPLVDEAMYNGFNLCLAANISPTTGTAKALHQLILQMMSDKRLPVGNAGITGNSVYINFNNQFKNLG